jgi:hypothetical protein
MPAWETDFAGHTIMWNVFVPGVVLVLAFFLIMGCYPFFEQWAADDTRPHQVLDRPRNMPARTAIGAAVLAMAADLQLAAATTSSLSTSTCRSRTWSGPFVRGSSSCPPSPSW